MTSRDPLTKLQTADPHAVHAYIVTITAVSASTGTCTIDPGDDGGALDQIGFVGPTPTVGDVLCALHFDGALWVLSTGT